MSVEGAVDRRPGRPRDARADVAIVEATLAELAERGFSGATVEGIASRAGVGKATIYRRWHSKAELLQFVAGQVSDVCAVPDTGSVLGDLRIIFQPMGDALDETVVGTLLPELIAEAARNVEIRDLMRSLAEERRAPALAVLRRAVDRCELPASADPETLADLIGGAIVYRRVMLTQSVTHADIDRIIRQALGMG
jgi:AcrR family transcriptional regulator